MRRVYLDYSATTPAAPEVVEAMLPYFTETFGNPSSIHQYGRQARKAVEEARATLDRLLGVSESEVIFVSGGTEADNLAVKGVALANQHRGKHIITSRVEHKAVLNSCKTLEKMGFEVTYLSVDRYGRVNPDQVREHLRRDTILISIIYANNEVGTINPMKEIGAIAREAGVPFHSDAVQAFGKIPVSVQEAGIDLLSFSSHKIYGPKGVGALYVRRGTPLWPLQHGGGHEKGRRAGTENVPAIVGLAAAAALAFQNMDEEARRIGELRDYFWQRIQAEIPEAVLNGHPTQRLYHNVHVSFPGCDSDTLLVALDMAGIAASSGSACDSGVVEPSHVLQAMGTSREVGRSALRFTLGRSTTREDLDYTVERLREIVERTRKIHGRSGKKPTGAVS